MKSNKLQWLLLLVTLTIISCDSDDGATPTPDEPKELTVTTLVDNFPANDGLFVANDGAIFASHFGSFDGNTGMGNGTTVYEISPEGNVTVKEDNIVAPMQGVMDSQGNFYTSQENEGVAGEIVQITSSGEKNVLGEVEGWPSGMTIDSQDNIYVANFVAGTIHKVTPSGNISLFASDALLAGCVGIGLDKDENIIAGNYNNGDIVKILPNGNVSLITTISDVVSGFGIGYIAIFENDIYATGIGNNLIYKVTMDGTTEVFAGTGENSSTDGLLLNATFSAPNGIAADPERRILYISEFGQPKLRKIQF